MLAGRGSRAAGSGMRQSEGVRRVGEEGLLRLRKRPRGLGQDQALGLEAAGLSRRGPGASWGPRGESFPPRQADRPRSENQLRNLAAASGTVLFRGWGVGRLWALTARVIFGPPGK